MAKGVRCVSGWPVVLALAVAMSCSAGQSACSNNFFQLEQSLLDSTDNRFQLLKAFYPPREAHPVVVAANYSFEGLNRTELWFWAESQFYLIQPLEVFQFTSLLFSNMPYRRTQLDLLVDAECSQASQEFFMLLTTRLKLYAQSSTTGPMSGTLRVSDSYIAVASSWKQISEDTLQSNFVKAWLHITVFVFPLATGLLLYLCDPIQLLLGDKTWAKLEDEHTHGTVAALMQIAFIFTGYVFVLDVAGVYYTLSSLFISDSVNAFYLSTVTGVLVDMAAFLWVSFVLLASCCSVWQRFRHQQASKGSERIKKLLSSVLLAPLLCLANHLHYIILAFISDPFHAGSIAIMYMLSFFLFLFLFRQFYNRVVLHSNKRPKKVTSFKLCPKCSTREALWHPTTHQQTSSEASTAPLTRNWSTEDVSLDNLKCNCFTPDPHCHTPFNTRVLIISLLTVGPLVVLYEGIVITLFFSLPITKSIEDAPSRIYTIYQGTGLIIVALLTYNIVLHPNPFSVPRTLDRLAKRLHLPETTNFWNRLSDEEKAAKVIATVLENHFQKVVHRSAKEREEGERRGEGEMESLRTREEDDISMDTNREIDTKL